MIPGGPNEMPANAIKVETAGIEPARCSRQNWIPKGETGSCVSCGTIFTAKQRARLCCSADCARRYARTQRAYKRVPLEQRFWKWATVGLPDSCWEWQGARDHHGYGRLHSPGGTGPVLKAHRVSYELHNGGIPEGLHILHRCDNPPCVNPAHLYAGDQAQNGDDLSRRGRSGTLKFTDEQVRELRIAVDSGTPVLQAAHRFGISESQAHNLAKGIQRRYAGGPIPRTER